MKAVVLLVGISFWGIFASPREARATPASDKVISPKLSDLPKQDTATEISTIPVVLAGMLTVATIAVNVKETYKPMLAAGIPLSTLGMVAGPACALHYVGNTKRAWKGAFLRLFLMGATYGSWAIAHRINQLDLYPPPFDDYDELCENDPSRDYCRLEDTRDLLFATKVFCAVSSVMFFGGTIASAVADTHRARKIAQPLKLPRNVTVNVEPFIAPGSNGLMGGISLNGSF